MMYVVQEVQAEAVWTNAIVKLSVSTGRVTPVMQTKRAEPTFIRKVLLSPSGRYLLVLRKDRPLELWDLSGGAAAHLGNVKPFIQINAVTWKFSDALDGDGMEDFAAATVDNVLRVFRVSNGRLSIVRQQESLTVSPMTCLAWRGEVLAAGDNGGGLSCFDWSRKVCWTLNTRGSALSKLAWNPLPSSSLMLVSFVSGALSVYDMSTKKLVNESSLSSVRSLRIWEADWVAADWVIASASDGALRVLDVGLTTCNSRLLAPRPSNVLTTPFLLESRVALALRVSLMRGGERLADDVGLDGLAVPSSLMNSILGAASVAERDLCLAKFFGDEMAEKIWYLVLQQQDQGKKVDVASLTAAQPTVATLIDFGSDAAFEPSVSDAAVVAPIIMSPEAKEEFLAETRLNNAPSRGGENGLPCHYGILRPDEDVRDQFIAETTALDYRRNLSDVGTFHVASERFIQYGDQHNAIRVLMGSDPAWECFEADSLMACVVAAASGPEYFERTAKMVAINLIVRGDIDRGVQLLVLVGKADEACRYLVDAGRWDDAVKLAKLQLQPEARNVVFRQWVTHLLAVDDFPRVVLVLLALGDIERTVSVLHGKEKFQLAVELLKHFEASTQLDHSAKAVHLDYGFFLHRLGLDSVAREHFVQAGDAGTAMLEAVGGIPSAFTTRTRAESLNKSSGEGGTTVAAAPARGFALLRKK